MNPTLFRTHRHAGRAILLCLAGLLLPLRGAGTAESAAGIACRAETEIDAAQLHSDSIRLAAARLLVEKALVLHPDDAALLRAKGWALYREAINLNRGHDQESAQQRFEEADRVLERSQTLQSSAETLALRGVVLDDLIGLRGMMAGMTLGPKAARLIQDATNLEPDNPRVLMLRGVYDYFTPEAFGGGVERALGWLNKAADAFGREAAAPASVDAWHGGRAETFVWIGRAQQRLKNTAAARAAFERALTLAPDYAWAKQLLASLNSANPTSK